MKRILMMLALTALLVVALSMSALSAFAAPPPCEPGAPGCKTEDDPNKNNPKFTISQRGNLDAPGTESTEEDCHTNPNGKVIC